MREAVDTIPSILNKCLFVSPDRQTDGRTDTRTQIFKRRVYHNTPHFLKWRGITMMLKKAKIIIRKKMAASKA